MTYSQIKLKNLVVVIATVFFAACNSNSSSDKIADTATAATYSGDTTQSVMPADTSTAAMSSAPTTTSTDTSTKTSVTASKSAANTTKKKYKASVVIAAPAKHPKPVMDKSGVYEYSEVMPSYPGGQSAVDDYVNNNINYPQGALDNGKEGRVLVAFTVDENGKISNAHTIGKQVGAGLDQEAVRVVSGMSKWNPGTVAGKPVKTRMTLPITFKIEE